MTVLVVQVRDRRQSVPTSRTVATLTRLASAALSTAHGGGDIGTRAQPTLARLALKRLFTSAGDDAWRLAVDADGRRRQLVPAFALPLDHANGSATRPKIARERALSLRGERLDRRTAERTNAPTRFRTVASARPGLAVDVASASRGGEENAAVSVSPRLAAPPVGATRARHLSPSASDALTRSSTVSRTASRGRSPSRVSPHLAAPSARPLPAQLSAALDAYRHERDRCWTLLDARGSAVVGSARLRGDVATQEVHVEAAIRRFRADQATVAAVVEAVGAARARFAAVVAAVEAS